MTSQLTDRNKQMRQVPVGTGRTWTIRGVDERDIVPFVAVTVTMYFPGLADDRADTVSTAFAVMSGEMLTFEMEGLVEMIFAVVCV